MDVVKVFGNNRHGGAMNKYLLGLAEVPAKLAAGGVAGAGGRRPHVRRPARPARCCPPSPTRTTTATTTRPATWRKDPGGVAAVWATSGQIIVDGANRPIDAFYSSSMGGWTEDNVYSWGGSPVSYLRPVNDSRWDRASDNPATLRSWTWGFTRRQVARALGFARVTSVFVFPAR